MRIGLLFILILTGCGSELTEQNNRLLSITPDKSFVPGFEQAAAISYDDHAIYVHGFVGDFKLVLKNESAQDLTNVKVIVVANDPALFSEIIFCRIYRTIFWGGNFFNFDNTPMLPNNEALFEAGSTYFPQPGLYAIFEADALEAYSAVKFDNIVLGKPGLELYFTAYADLPDETHYALPMDATNIQWNYTE